jgi:hypothetical protein
VGDLDSVSMGFGRLDNHQLAQTVSSLELRRKPHDEADLGVGCKRLFIRLRCL